MTTINSVAGLNTKYSKLNNAEPQTDAPKPVDAPKTNELAKDTVSFSGHNEEGKVAKKHPFKAIASFLLPGSGQVANGEVKKGVFHLGFAALIGIPAFLVNKKAILSVLENVKNAGTHSKLKVALLTAAAIPLSLLSIRTGYISAKDSYNGGNKEA